MLLQVPSSSRFFCYRFFSSCWWSSIPDDSPRRGGFERLHGDGRCASAKRDYLGLLAVSNRHGEAIARVVQKMLDFTTKNPNADFQQVREIAETEGTRVAASLNNRVTYLADIGMIAPLLGLLGTVFGIIRSFGALGADLGSARYVALSHGISQALVNTAAGLAIGIPAMIFYAFFRGGSQRLISELEAAVDPCSGVAFIAIQWRTSERTPVLIEDEL